MNIRALVKRFGTLLLDLLYPEGAVCLCCRERSDGNLLCGSCSRQLDAVRRKHSRIGDIGLVIDAAEVRAVWQYRDEAAQLIRLLKFHCIRSAAEVLADAIAEEAGKMDLPPETVVTSVAMPAKRIRQRGIDHGRVLAEMVAQRLGLPYKALLSREPGGHTQRGLNRDQRIRNLSGRFTSIACSGEPVLLVDDVLTTGATAAVCTRALLDAGSGPVRVIAAAHVNGRRIRHV